MSIILLEEYQRPNFYPVSHLYICILSYLKSWSCILLKCFCFTLQAVRTVDCIMHLSFVSTILGARQPKGVLSQSFARGTVCWRQSVGWGWIDHSLFSSFTASHTQAVSFARPTRQQAIGLKPWNWKTSCAKKLP